MTARTTGGISSERTPSDLSEVAVSGVAAGELAGRQPVEPLLPVAAHLRGLGTALPSIRLRREESRDALADLWRIRGARRAWWERIVDGTRIECRYATRPLDEVIRLGTAARMRVYAIEAPRLAERAARQALRRAGIEAGEVTDLIVVSCTGFGAPGIDCELVTRLGLPTTVRRTQIGFMGCFGAITGLRAAAGACCADPGSTTLMVCVELCTLHLRDDTGTDNMVASALFGDGAAAAVLTGARPTAASGPSGNSGMRRVALGHSALLEAHRGAMTWTITDEGFAMTLDRRVPEIVLEHVAAAVKAARLDARRDLLAVHPGGASILDAVDDALGLDGRRGIEQSRAVLRDPGNVSSGTVLFVLQRLLVAERMASKDADGRDHQGIRPIGVLAFGPGLTIESVVLV